MPEIRVIPESILKGIETITLEKIKFGIVAEVPMVLQDLRVFADHDVFFDKIIAKIRWSMAGKNLKTIWYPKDWWEAFKERWFRGWLRKRCPVVYRVVDIKALYPDMVQPSKTVPYTQRSLRREDNWVEALADLAKKQ